MTIAPAITNSRKRTLHRWIRYGFLLWAFGSTLWLANSYRTRDVAAELIQSAPEVTVVDDATGLEFLRTPRGGTTALIFICGSGVSAQAYAPLLRPIADGGFSVFVVKLPWRFAPLESHQQAALERVRRARAAHPGILHWVIAGHSLGGALACRAAQAEPNAYSALVLVGTTHPKRDDMSSLTLPVTKVYTSNDGVAPIARTLANKGLLPQAAQWVEITGGNHSQFGHYGHQLFDGKPTIGRDAQQAATRSALLAALTRAKG